MADTTALTARPTTYKGIKMRSRLEAALPITEAKSNVAVNVAP